MGVCINNIIEKIVPGDWGKEDTDNSGVRVIRTTNFTNVGKIDFSNIVTRIITDKKIRERQLIKGDIIIEKSGGSPNQPVGRVVYFDEDDNGEPILCNNFTSVIRCKSDVNSRYIFYYLYLNWCKGGTRKYQNKTTGILNLKLEKYLDDIVIELPTLEEQNRIVSLLDKADEIRAKKRLANEKLDEFLKSTFISMFGDPVTNNKNFPKQKLETFLENVRYGTSTPPNFSDYGYSFIRATNIKKGRIVDEGMYFVSEEEATKISKCKLKENEIIIVRSGINTGDTCIITREYAGHYAGYDIILTINEKELNPTYLNELLNTNYMIVVIKPLTRRAAQPHLNADQIKNLEIIIPPIEDQNKFAQIVEKVEAQKQKNEEVIEQMDNLFNSLSQRAFKGEL